MAFLELGSGRIEYSWFGTSDPDAPILVFLHDGIGCLSLWRDFPAKVAEETHCKAFVYSRFGYGLSDPVKLPRPTQFMHEEASLLPEIFEAMNITHPILIGHSDGASISLIHAGSDSGHNVRALILEAPHVFVEEITVRSIAEAGEDYSHGNLKQRLERYHGKNVDVAFWGWNQVWLNPEFRFWNIEEYLTNIRCPVLIIQGEQDQFGTKSQAESIRKNCKGEVKTVFLQNCKHTPHKEQTRLTFTEMVNFIRIATKKQDRAG